MNPKQLKALIPPQDKHFDILEAAFLQISVPLHQLRLIMREIRAKTMNLLVLDQVNQGCKRRVSATDTEKVYK